MVSRPDTCGRSDQNGCPDAVGVMGGNRAGDHPAGRKTDQDRLVGRRLIHDRKRIDDVVFEGIRLNL